MSGNIVTILNDGTEHTVRITKTKFKSMSIQVSGVGYDYNIYKLSFPLTRSLITKEPSPFHISKTNIEIIYLPHVKGNNVSCTLINEEENWKGAILFVSNDDENYSSIGKCK